MVFSVGNEDNLAHRKKRGKLQTSKAIAKMAEIRQSAQRVKGIRQRQRAEAAAIASIRKSKRVKQGKIWTAAVRRPLGILKRGEADCSVPYVSHSGFCYRYPSYL